VVDVRPARFPLSRSMGGSTGSIKTINSLLSQHGADRYLRSWDLTNRRCGGVCFRALRVLKSSKPAGLRRLRRGGLAVGRRLRMKLGILI
jgi:hypothetical protein